MKGISFCFTHPVYCHRLVGPDHNGYFCVFLKFREDTETVETDKH